MCRFIKFEILSSSDAKLYVRAPRLGKGTSPLQGPVAGPSVVPSPKRAREAEDLVDEFSSVKGEKPIFLYAVLQHNAKISSEIPRFFHLKNHVKK